MLSRIHNAVDAATHAFYKGEWSQVQYARARTHTHTHTRAPLCGLCAPTCFGAARLCVSGRWGTATMVQKRKGTDTMMHAELQRAIFAWAKYVTLTPLMRPWQCA